LSRRGTEVIVHILSAGTRENLAWKRDTDAPEFVTGDIRDVQLVRELAAGGDCVFHQAAVASVPRSVDDPLGTNQHSLDGTLAVLQAAREARARRMVLASSSAVYGESDRPAKTEDDLPDPPSPYALQKHAGERYAQLFTRL
jgi:UDP-glucose 4-epimerase